VKDNKTSSAFASFVEPFPQCKDPATSAASLKTLFVRPNTDRNNAFLTWGGDHPQEEEIGASQGFKVEVYKPLPTDANASLLTSVGKTIHVYGFCRIIGNCFKIFRVEDATKRYWLFGEIPIERLADVPVFVQQITKPSDPSKSRVINMRETLLEWLSDHPQTNVEIYRTGGNGQALVDLYQRGDLTNDFTEHYTPGVSITHFSHNVRYSESRGTVIPENLGLVKVRLPVDIFRDMLSRNLLQIHALRNSIVTYPVPGAIYVDEANPELLDGLPMEFLIKKEAAPHLAKFSKPENGGYQGMFCKFPSLKTPCSQIRAREIER
jgi:hypothetical protein